MSRATDSTNTDAPGAATPAPGARRGITQHGVCPFCGLVSENPAGACRQCGMENTQATRAATRGKIGPWFVWQARNPSAPGMNWATLTSLVERGRITPRSVIRGPTTGQLWRFAARVKGLSREFGVCWHCGGEIARTARLCPSCKRLQQPPVHPDALLETDAAPGSPVPQNRPLTDPRYGGLTESATPEPAPAAPSPAVNPEPPPPPATPRRFVPPPAPVDARPLPIEAAPPEVVRGALPIIDMGDHALPAGMEMRAYQLPDSYGAGGRTRSRLGRKLLLAATLAIASGAAAGWYSPQFRQQCAQGYANLMARVNGNGGRAAPSHSPDALGESVPATHRESGSSAALPITPVLPDPPRTSAAKSANTYIPATHPTPPAATTRPAKAAITKPSPENTPPKSQITFGPGDASAATTKSGNGPLVTITPTAPPVASGGEAKVQVTPPPSDPTTAVSRAWDLREAAINFERNGDYANAVKEYEWIQQLRLPDGAGPTDVESRLNLAREHLKQAKK